MTVPAGTRLGPYEIISPIGAGGMGEVCRARDTRLRPRFALLRSPLSRKPLGGLPATTTLRGVRG